MNKFHYILLALSAGTLMPVQAGINKLLGDNLGGPMPAAFVSFFVGTVALGLLVAAGGMALPLGTALAASPWWYWIGGTFGAFFVASSIVLAPALGAGTMTAFILAGQITASLILDNFGVLGFPHIPFDVKRLAGAVLLAAGVWLIRG
jgi:bacterial/archaeal transporter family-2 protein